MQQEEWPLGPAAAGVFRLPGCVLVELRGVVTAQAYEALLKRMSRESRRDDLRLVIGPAALLVATPRSLAEAACRGTRIGDEGRVTLIVSSERRAWVCHYLAACQHEGLAWRLGPVPQQEAIRAA